MFDDKMVGRMKFQQAVTGRQVSNIDLEVNEDFQQRGWRTLAAVYDPVTARVPAARRSHPAVARERRVVADAPQDHLRGHAVVDAIQQLLDEPRSGFRAKHLQRCASLEPALAISNPSPTPPLIAEYFLAQRNHACDSDRTIGFVSAQCFASSASMSQRPPGNDQRVDLFIG